MSGFEENIRMGLQKLYANWGPHFIAHIVTELVSKDIPHSRVKISANPLYTAAANIKKNASSRKLISEIKSFEKTGLHTNNRIALSDRPVLV